MSAFARLTTWVLLFALALALGDGPFVDEVLAEGSQQQQFQPAPDVEHAEAAAPAGCITVYATLMYTAGAVWHGVEGAPPLRHALPAFGELPYTSTSLPPADKPPRSIA